MEPQTKPRVTPKDFFLWVGGMAALYASVVAFITLLFQYINYAFPDPLTYYYADPYAGPIRLAIASLIVLFPVFLILMRVIRRDITRDATRADIWIRRWALYLTLFIAGITLIADLITLINTFLNGDVTMRFVLKVAVVFLVVGAGFLHFLSDLRGYWTRYPGRARLIGYGAALVIVLTIVSGFFIIGTPGQARLERFNQQKVSDLQNIQWRIVNFWQQKERLPASLAELEDPISGFTTPVDAQTGNPYGYRSTGANSFELCATFNRESRGEGNQSSVLSPRPVDGYLDENWQHSVGETCFDRTIDPELYPPIKR